MSDLSTAIHGILFFALFPALIILMLFLDRIWPSNCERQESARRERGPSAQQARRSHQF